jgi:hypothetical protein
MKAREAIDGIGRILLDRMQEGFTGQLVIRVEYSQGGIRSVKAASEPEYDEVHVGQPTAELWGTPGSA